MHSPAAQIWPVPQAVAHLPQWVGSVCRSTQAVAVVRPEVTEHEVKPVPQAARHPPAWQSLLLLKSAGHESLHALQLKGSLWTLTQVVPQSMRPGAHAVPVVQAPFTHAWPPVHCVVQLPQNSGSVAVATHAVPPSPGVHSVCVAVSHVTPQSPLVHVGAPVVAPETGPAQALAQAPQLSGSVCSSTQASPQASFPPVQVTAQASLPGAQPSSGPPSSAGASAGASATGAGASALGASADASGKVPGGRQVLVAGSHAKPARHCPWASHWSCPGEVSVRIAGAARVRDGPRGGEGQRGGGGVEEAPHQNLPEATAPHAPRKQPSPACAGGSPAPGRSSTASSTPPVTVSAAPTPARTRAAVWSLVIVARASW